ncbi:MAG: type II secretion system protein [Armatimonadota bacterium]
MKHQKAFTLIEMLIVVAIIALLVSLLFPVLLNARRHAQISPCISNLKQLYAALTMYRDDCGGCWPYYLARLEPYVRSHEVYRCPLDTFGGAIETETIAFWGANGKYPVSYLSVLLAAGTATHGPLGVPHPIHHTELANFFRALQREDPNHGVAVCMLHGERGCDWVWRAYEMSGIPSIASMFHGLTLRLRLDGSVQRAKVPYVGNGCERFNWYLLTDVPCPEDADYCRLNIS